MQKKRCLKTVSLLLALIMVSVMVFAVQAAEASDDYAWVLVETQYRRTGTTEYTSTPAGVWQSSNFYSEYLNHSERRIELKRTSQRGRTSSDPPMNMHVIYTWSAPPSVIRANDNISFNVNQELPSNVTGGYSAHLSWSAEAGRLLPLLVSEPQEIAGERSLIFGAPSANVKLFEQSGSAVFTADGWGAGQEGSQRTISVYAGSGGSLGTREQYIYEWKKVSTTAPAPPQPAAKITINIDNNPLQTDVPPIILDGRTMVPLRAIFEALGIEVEYIAQTRTIIGVKGDSSIRLTVDSTQATVNGAAATLDVPAMVIDGRTLVPVRFIAESTGQDVVWDGAARRVNITTK